MYEKQNFFLLVYFHAQILRCFLPQVKPRDMSETTFNPTIIEMRGVQVAALRDTSLTVLEDVNWSVLPGEFWVVAGPQYSGKSDLLMHAAGLMTPMGGTCRVFGCETDAFGEAQL